MALHFHIYNAINSPNAAIFNNNEKPRKSHIIASISRIINTPQTIH